MYKTEIKSNDSFHITDSNFFVEGLNSPGVPDALSDNDYTAEFAGSYSSYMSIYDPDFSVIDLFDLEESYRLDETITISFRITNQGGSIFSPTVAYIYVDGNYIASTSIKALDYRGYTTVTYSFSAADLTSGTHSIKIKADGDDAIYESDENNNWSETYYFYVSPFGKPNLQAFPSKFSKSSYAKDETAEFSFYIRNAGDVSASSSQAHIYVDNVYYDSVNISSLAAHEETKISYRFSAGDFSVGSHYICILADGGDAVSESLENDNWSTDTWFSVTKIKPDLRAGSLDFSQTSYSQGETVSLSFSIGNYGETDSPESYAYIYIDGTHFASVSVDQIEAAGDVVSAVGKNLTYTFSSANFSTGRHTVEIRADGADTIDESDENNNWSESATFFVTYSMPDLSVSGISLSQTSYSWDETVSLSFNISNSGFSSVSSFIAAVYIDENYWGDVSIESLGADQKETFTFDFSAADLTAGTHTVKIKVDGDGVIYESDERNNWSESATFAVESSLPDLKISGLSFSSSSIILDQSVTLNFNVINEGNAAAEGSRAEIYDGEIKLGSVDISALAAGESAEYSYTIPGDTLSVGVHDIRVAADAAGAVEEFDESNNTVFYSLQVLSNTNNDPSLVVTTEEDVVDSGDGVVSLREALAYAAELGGKQKITFASDYNIILNSTLNINSDVFIDGENKNVIVSVNTPALDVFSSTAEYLKINNIDFFATNQKNELFEKDQNRGRLLYLNQGEFYLSNSSIEGFKTEVLINTADETYLQIDNCFFGNNNAGERNGGAIFIEGDALINNTTFFNNYAEVGGAVFVGETGKTNIVNCSFVNNRDADTGFGISIHNQGSMFVQNSIIVNASRYSRAIGQNMSPYMCIRNNIFSTLYFESSDDCYAADNITDCNTKDIYLDVDVDTDNIGNKYLAADPSKIKSIAVLSAVDQYNNLYYSVDGVTWFSSDDKNAASTHLNDYLSQNIIGNRYVKNNVTGVLCSDNQLIFTGNSNRISWNGISGSKFVTKISRNDFANSLQISPGSNVVNIFGIPSGEYQWRVSDGEAWFNGNDFISSNVSDIQQEFVSNADGNMDLFFANASGKWAVRYAAQHTGVLNGWDGTGERVFLSGKNKLADIFEGSSDANVLVMTDDANGDVLFVDDIYTALPGTVAEQQARIAQIDEIRAGNGDDVVDMTSQRFAYVGDGTTIYGGLGNDVIWANNGENKLFGDAGNDRLVGGSDDDVIIGGLGNDSMHGGGGNDIFCFGENWGIDTVEQLSGGSVTLWFESGSESNWDAETLTYSDGINSVTVSGTSSVSLRFGTEADLPAGCFDDAASEKIFEDKNKGMLA